MKTSIKSIEFITDAQDIEDIFNPEAYDHESHIILEIEANPLWMTPDYFDIVINVKNEKVSEYEIEVKIDHDITLTCSKTRSPTHESTTNTARLIRFHSIRNSPYVLDFTNKYYNDFIEELKNEIKTFFC